MQAELPVGNTNEVENRVATRGRPCCVGGVAEIGGAILDQRLEALEFPP